GRRRLRQRRKRAFALCLGQCAEPARGGVEGRQVVAVLREQRPERRHAFGVGGDRGEVRVGQRLREPAVIAGVAAPLLLERLVVAAQRVEGRPPGRALVVVGGRRRIYRLERGTVPFQ